MLLQSYDLIGKVVHASTELDFTVKHKPRADNSNAEELSRQAEDGLSFEKKGDVRILTQD